MSGSLDIPPPLFFWLWVFICVHRRRGLSQPPAHFHQFVVFSFCYLFFPSALPISPLGSLKFHLSPCLCLVVINSQWTEHSDGSAQYFSNSQRRNRAVDLCSACEFLTSSNQPSCSAVVRRIICSIIRKTLRHLCRSILSDFTYKQIFGHCWCCCDLVVVCS